LFFLALKEGSPAPVINKDLVMPSYGNFSGSLAIPEANVSVSVTLCVADGGTFQLYGLVQAGVGSGGEQMIGLAKARWVELCVSHAIMLRMLTSRTHLILQDLQGAYPPLYTPNNSTIKL